MALGALFCLGYRRMVCRAPGAFLLLGLCREMATHVVNRDELDRLEKLTKNQLKMTQR